MKTRTRNALGVGLLLLAQSALADFSGPYAIANWTTPQSFGCAFSNVNTAGAPASVTINAATCASIIQGFMHNGAPSNGTISFSYSGYTPANAVANWDIGGASTLFPGNATGTVTVPVTTGKKFQITLTRGAGNGSLTISNFVFTPAAPAAPASIPTLSEWGLIGLAGLMALFGLARTRRARQD